MTPDSSTYLALEVVGLRQLLAEKDAEIARLRAEYLKLDEQLEQSLRKNENQATLITELCDALEQYGYVGDFDVEKHIMSLLQRGRKETR